MKKKIKERDFEGKNTINQLVKYVFVVPFFPSMGNWR